MTFGEDYDPPSVSTFSYIKSKDSRDEFIDIFNDMGIILKERKLIDKEIRLTQRRKLIVQYNDYSSSRPTRKYSEKWISDGDHIAGIHPITYLPFFMNSSGTTICRLCEGEIDIEMICKELNSLYPSIEKSIILNDLLSFLLLLEEMDLLELNR
jgi:hypothetical protein